MILFFANNRALSDYFQKLVNASNGRARIYRQPLSGLPAFRYFFSLDEAFIDKHIALLEKNAISRGKPSPGGLKKRWQRFLARWYFACDSRVISNIKPELVVVWNGLAFRRAIFAEAARSQGIKRAFMENGLLPNTTVCDSKGINAVNSMPRDAAFYHALEDGENDRAIKLVARDAKVPKQASGKTLPEHFLFVPFQVDYDTQILIFSDWICNMQQLFEAILAAQPRCPDYRLVFKEHPSSVIDYHYLHPQLAEEQGIFANDYNTQTLIEKAEAVITINSTVGIEALLLGKKVILLGDAFYNIEGLVLSAGSVDELVSAISQLEHFEPAPELRRKFLHYLEHEYLIPGSWKEADRKHCERVLSRLESFIQEVSGHEQADSTE